jgi:prepilin-type N-terminal cleavage/methylation domain-containing protein
MSTSRNRRSGFTLPEVLVTVAIVAVLAAVVVPAVTQQLAKADGPSLGASLGSLRTAVTAFVTDVKKFPRRISQLAILPVATDSALGAVTIGAKGASAWKGPYVSFSMASGDSINLGMNLKALDSLTSTTSSPANMIQMDLSGSTSNAEMLRVDSLIDGATGLANGNLRWTNTAGVASALKYYLTSSR